MEKNNIKKSQSASEYDSHRQQNVLLEKIYSEVKIVTEGHSGLDRKIDKTNERLDVMSVSLDIITNKVSGHSKKLSEHDRCFGRIETVVSENRKDVKELRTDIKKIEQKLDTFTSDHEQRIQKLESVK